MTHRLAVVDSSALAALLFGEPAGAVVAARLEDRSLTRRSVGSALAVRAAGDPRVARSCRRGRESGSGGAPYGLRRRLPLAGSLTGLRPCHARPRACQSLALNGESSAGPTSVGARREDESVR
jgi:hypothetical protein